MSDTAGLRSDAWLGGDDEVAPNHRAALGPALGPGLGAAGSRRSGGRSSGRPLIGIACTASDLNRCDRGLTTLAAAVKRGVRAAGGLPLEFPVMSLSEDLMKPTAIKAAAASSSLLRHRGPAVVFQSYDEMRRRIDDPSLDVTPSSVLVLAGCGPVGMAMPEWGNIPIPAKLLGQGVTDMLRITDGRMSGTGFGTVVLHVAPGERGRRAVVPAARRGHGVARRLCRVLVGLGRLERSRACAARSQRPAGLAGAAPDARPAGARGLRLRLPAG